MESLLTLGDRRIFLVETGPPAVYYLADRALDGVLINAPRFSESLWAQLSEQARPRYLFLPSHRGACDLALWRQAGVTVLASQEEAAGIPDVDIAFDSQQKLSRTIDFLPLAGRTRGTCGLRLKNLPGVLFMGPALRPGPSGWPELQAEPDDYSYEARLMGIFALQDIAFQYLFTDHFVPGHTQFGPGAREALRAHLDALLA